MARGIDDVMAEMETIRQLQADAKTQLARTRNSIAIKLQEIGALELHEYSLITAIDGRTRKADRLLDELSVMLSAHAIAEALVDEDGEPARTMPSGRMV